MPLHNLGSTPKDPESQLEVLWCTLINNTTFQEIYFSYFDAYFASCARERDGIKPLSTSSFSATTNDMAREFRDTVLRRMRYRRLCVTKDEYFGAVPQESLAGDLICVFEGGRPLFVVRKREDKTGYHLIGPAYVYGLMKGEALTSKRHLRQMIRLI